MHGIISLETYTTKTFNDFLETSGCNSKQFRRVSMDDLPIVDDVV